MAAYANTPVEPGASSAAAAKLLHGPPTLPCAGLTGVNFILANVWSGQAHISLLTGSSF